MSIVVLCPSRNRPAQAAQVLASFELTRRDPDSQLIFLVDADDQTRDAYPASRLVIDPPPGCMNAALTAGTPQILAANPGASIIGFVGDDHRFRTENWDVIMRDFLTSHPGIGYADDLFQRVRLPTMWFVSRPIVEVFGMGHPEMRHLWIDNFWQTLGEGAGCLYYFPQVVIEHLHPAAGKGVWDEDYLRVNSDAIAVHDRGVYEAWLANGRAADVARLRTLLA